MDLINDSIYYASLIDTATEHKEPINRMIGSKNFTEFPANAKRINKDLGYRSYIFYFNVPDIEKSKFYKFKINGRLIYKNKLIQFHKEIQTKRSKELKEDRMMT